jgi:hypothetical protein
MESTYSIRVKGDDAKADGAKAGDKKQAAKDLKLDSGNKLSVGDNVMLDGKRHKVSSVTLNATTGKYDVEVEAPQEGVARPTAEGNDPHPERRAVKDVVNDPKFTPAVEDVHRPASENAAVLAGDVSTGSVEGPLDEKTGKHRALGADVPREEQKARLASEKGQQGNQPQRGREAAERRTDQSETQSRTAEGSKSPADTAAIRR